MISPLLRSTAMPAKQARILFIVYVVRHTLGVLAFTWMISIGMQVGGVYAWLFPVIGIAYLATAVYNGHKLYTQYRRRLAKEQKREVQNASS